MHPLRSYRKRNSLSQSDIAAMIGSTKGTICRIERGREAPSFNLVERIVRATGGGVDANAFLPPDLRSGANLEAAE